MQLIVHKKRKRMRPSEPRFHANIKMYLFALLNRNLSSRTPNHQLVKINSDAMPKTPKLYRIFVSALLIHRDIPLNKFHNYALGETENNVPFSIDRMPSHPISFHAAHLDAMRCLSVPLQGRLPHSACSDRKSFSRLEVRMQAACR